MFNKFFNLLSYYQWWKNLDKFILGLIIVLFLVGLFFSLVSTSLIASDKLNTNSYFFFFKHLIFVSIGLILIFIFSYIDKEILYKSSIYIFLLFFLLLVLVPIIGTEVKTAKRWLDIFFLPRFQPIEFLKPFIIILLATILSSKKNFHVHYKYFLSFVAILPVSFLLMINQILVKLY